MGVDEFVTGGDVQNPAVESLETDELQNVWDWIVEAGDDENLANGLDALANGEIESLWIPDPGDSSYYAPGDYIPLPVDISNSSVRVEGDMPAPRSEEEQYNPDITADALYGPVIDLGGASALFAGTDIYGSEIGGFTVTNGLDGLDFGGVDELGISFSNVSNIFGYDLTGSVLNWTNSQQNYVENVKSRLTKRVAHLKNDHHTHQGANSTFVGLYCQTRELSDGTKPMGGIRVEAFDRNHNHMTFIRPQVNMFRGTDGTGANMYFDSSGEGKANTTITVLGGDFEGKAKVGIHAKNVFHSFFHSTIIQATDNSARFEQGGGQVQTTSSGNLLIVGEGTSAPHSDHPSNMVLGRFKEDPTGKWMGQVRNDESQEVIRMHGGEVGTYDMRFSENSVQLQNLNVSGPARFGLADRDLNNISESGSLFMRHNGTGAPAGLYEWKGSQWVEVSPADGTPATITP